MKGRVYRSRLMYGGELRFRGGDRFAEPYILSAAEVGKTSCGSNTVGCTGRARRGHIPLVEPIKAGAKGIERA